MAGTNGDIFIWDHETRQCLKRFKDDGCLRLCSIAVSPNGKYLVTGQDNGIVNVYDLVAIEANPASNLKTVTPLKTFFNLVTAISNLVFNHDSQILLMASHSKSNALRLIHMDSLTVFANWPPIKDKYNLGRVTKACFSPDSHYLAIGNTKGKVRLNRMHFYHPEKKFAKDD